MIQLPCYKEGCCFSPVKSVLKAAHLLSLLRNWKRLRYFLYIPSVLVDQPQLVVQVDSQVPVGLDNFNICPINADRREWQHVPFKVHHHLLALLHVQLQVVLVKLLHESFYQVPLLIFPTILHTPDYAHVIRECLQMTQLSAVLIVRSVSVEEKGEKHSFNNFNKTKIKWLADLVLQLFMLMLRGGR